MISKLFLMLDRELEVTPVSLKNCHISFGCLQDDGTPSWEFPFWKHWIIRDIIAMFWYIWSHFVLLTKKNQILLVGLWDSRGFTAEHDSPLPVPPNKQLLTVGLESSPKVND